MTIALIFPGQGSQYLGMLQGLIHEPVVQHTLEEASTALRFDVATLIERGPLEQLNLTENTQPALLAVSIAYYRLWQERGGQDPQLMAGHSLGEYSALVVSGAISFADACRLTKMRGQFMQAAVPANVGAMAAIIGLSNEQVDKIADLAAEGDVVSSANYNAVGQVVISGEAKAVRRAMALATLEGARLCTELSVSVPSHCALMKTAAVHLEEALATITINATRIPVVHNVDVTSESSPSAIRSHLISQLYSPVRWVDTILHMRDQGVTTFIECGPSRVLVGLNKRIDKALVSIALDDPEGFEKALDVKS